jgi:hypothetical protein
LEPASGADDVQREFAVLERNAVRLRYFLPAIPTGLIQTPEYMRCVMTQTSVAADKEVEQAMARKAMLEDLDKRFEFLLTEPAIRWQLCEADVMARQIEHLASLSYSSSQPNGRSPSRPVGI